jgi:hypothetical protein
MPIERRCFILFSCGTLFFRLLKRHQSGGEVSLNPSNFFLLILEFFMKTNIPDHLIVDVKEQSLRDEIISSWMPSYLVVVQHLQQVITPSAVNHHQHLRHYSPVQRSALFTSSIHLSLHSAPVRISQSLLKHLLSIERSFEVQ